ncbi:lipopolysaccharide biosynthesis protein [Flavobacterium subsaxonicum]|uniref:Polysaccharide biosynthesis protein n=1 Tax=Flavobacterium subsaxonicum WB 4.1-42 = DSM 21790 TaxID=1121898 RepID=A0A0A2MMA0_9FLAO|nr:polysaccharide biosynthesis C-terminal domain-containing protein [Flavobacterium subsaxonicum]KGO92676.1 polysaccharide biosynthesis protein [Flavobacterium subsaxonicum WB 4.1-42 = DSM 21790]
MSVYKNLFKQTAIYGIATVVPRMFSFILTPLYTGVMDNAKYADVSIIFSWLVFFNVILAYGMETAFFRFYNSSDKKQVVSTTTISLFWSSLAFLSIALLSRNFLAEAAEIDTEYITYTIWVLALDALVIVPFSKLRAEGRPMVYAAIKIGNVVFNLFLNIFFLLWLPHLAANNPDSFIATLYVPDFEVGYVFVANVMASLATLLVVLPHYIKLSWHFNATLWKSMMRYALPIMVAGIAFAINETFDRPLLKFMDVAPHEIGAYAACYRLALFMTLFTTAFRLGIEPFFFSHAGNANAPQTYATVTKYFVIFGSVILLGVVAFADLLKIILLRDESFWEAMDVVPLIILANFFLGIYTNLSVWYKLSDKTKMGAYISIVGAVVTLSFNFALIPVWGYMGSAIATVAAYGTMMVVSYYMGAKYYPIPYDLKKMGLYVGLSVGLSALTFYVPVLRHTYVFGIVALFVFMAIIYRGEKETLQRILKRK